jgi:hypothetical protein
MRRPLPIIPYEQTSSDPADWSLCHKRSFEPVESEFACLALSPFALSGKEADA